MSLKNVTTKAYEGFKELPMWAKGVIAVGGIAVTYFAISGFVKRIKKDAQFKQDNKGAEIAAKELSDLEKRGVHPTLTSSQIDSLIQSLVESMNDCGTTEEKIYAVFKQLKNEADIRKLIADFSIRYYRPCVVSSPISYFKLLSDDHAFGVGLSTWLNYDLNSSEIAKINKILEGNKIKYQF